MAWSDAARAAAAEARRMHAHAKGVVHKLHYTHSHTPTIRGNLAVHLKAIRAGTSRAGVGVSFKHAKNLSHKDVLAIYHSASSTHFRNVGRLKRGYRE